MRETSRFKAAEALITHRNRAGGTGTGPSTPPIAVLPCGFCHIRGLRKPLFHISTALAAPPLALPLPCRFGTTFGRGNLQGAPKPHPPLLAVALLMCVFGTALAAEAFSNSGGGWHSLGLRKTYTIGENRSVCGRKLHLLWQLCRQVLCIICKFVSNQC